jgi:hypothetical protein
VEISDRNRAQNARDQVAQSEEDTPSFGLWTNLGPHPRPSLPYVVTTPIDLDIPIEAPLMFTWTMRYMNAGMPDSTIDTTLQIGGAMPGPCGASSA